MSILGYKLNTRNQFSVNIISNVVIFLFNLLMGLWLTPYLINYLGVSAYGLIPLAISTTSYINILTISINGAVGRFLSISIYKQDMIDSNKTFSTAFFVILIIDIFLLPLTLLFVYSLPKIFNVPDGQIFQSKLLFLFMILTFFVTTIDSIFSVVSWSMNRLELKNAIYLLSLVSRFVFINILFWKFGSNLFYVGLSYFLASVVGLVGDIILWRVLLPDLHIKIFFIRKRRYKELFGMSGWLIINQIGLLILLNIDLIIANKLLGSKLAGEYGSIILFTTMLRTVSTVISSVLTPIVIQKFAQNNIKSIQTIVHVSIKFMMLILVLPVGMIIGFSKSMLSVWLGNDFVGLWFLLTIMIFHLPMNLSMSPLISIQTALNRVKWPGISTIVFGLVNLAMSIIFINIFHMGLIGIALAGAIALSMRNVIFIPLYTARIQNLPWYTYLLHLPQGIIVLIFLSTITFTIQNLLIFDSWLKLIIVVGIISILYLVVSYNWLINKNEKAILISLLPSKVFPFAYNDDKYEI